MGSITRVASATVTMKSGVPLVLYPRDEKSAVDTATVVSVDTSDPKIQYELLRPAKRSASRLPSPSIKKTTRVRRLTMRPPGKAARWSR